VIKSGLMTKGFPVDDPREPMTPHIGTTTPGRTVGAPVDTAGMGELLRTR
jgi:hypothetical protein